MSAPALHLTYIAVCIGVLVLVHRAPAFDLRSLRRRISSDERAEPPRFDLLERPDLGAVLGLLVIGGTMIAMLIGWRVPAEVERIWGQGASFGLIFPNVDMTMLGRLAQVVGVVCFGLVALRLLRILVLFAAASLGGAGGIAALDYVFQLGWLF